MIAQKFALAFYYQAFGHSLSDTGRIWISIPTNADHVSGDGLEELVEMASKIVTPIRNNKAMGDQFAVRWESSRELSSAIFIAHLQRRLIFHLLVVDDPSAVGREFNDASALRRL